MLTDGVDRGQGDRLLGLKENVIIGKLIPAAMGRKKYRGIDIELSEPLPAGRSGPGRTPNCSRRSRRSATATGSTSPARARRRGPAPGAARAVRPAALPTRRTPARTTRRKTRRPPPGEPLPGGRSGAQPAGRPTASNRAERSMPSSPCSSSTARPVARQVAPMRANTPSASARPRPGRDERDGARADCVDRAPSTPP